jgi:hypothetical protein
VNYQQHLALAMVAFGEGDLDAALAGLNDAMAEAVRLDPEGPRVAELCGYLVQVRQKAGDAAGAAEAQARAEAIWARFPGL